MEIPALPASESHKPSFFNRKPRHIYGDQLLFLLVLLGMAVIRSGTRSVMLSAAAVLTSIVIDIFCCHFSKKVYNPRDLSTLTSGLCLALMSPASLPYSLLMFGAALAIGVKHIFGGKDNYIFNPTATAFAFLIICYPASMLLFPAPGESLAVFGEIPLQLQHGLENLLLRRGEFPPLSGLDLILGNFPGPIGTTHVLIIIISAVCLLFRRSVSFVVTISCLSVITISRILFPIYDDVIGALVRELFGGYLLFALLFLANDPQTLPKTVFGRLYYGVLLGLLTIAFRGSADGVIRGRVEGWFIFALLIANTFSYRMDLAAARIADKIALMTASLKRKLSAYERFSEDVKTGKEFSGDITATMEIELDPSHYNMPVIENKVIKVKRKKRNVLAVINDFRGSLREKAKRRREAAKTAEPESSFIAESYKTLIDTVKNIKAGEDPKAMPDSANVFNNANVLPGIAVGSSSGESKSNINITDFDEIKETVSEIEAKVEAEIKRKEAEEAELARIAAELEAQRIAEEEERLRIEAEKEAARLKAEAEKAEAKAQAEIERAEAKAQKDAEKAEAKAKKEAEKAQAEAAKAEAKAQKEAEAQKAIEALKAAVIAEENPDESKPTESPPE